LYTAAQAAAGGETFEANCSACHGEQAEGGAGPALHGGTFVTLSKNTHLKVKDIFTFMSQEMPLNAPATLSKDQYVTIMAFLLKLNGYPHGSHALTFAGAKSSNVPLTTLPGH
ncbi:MAG: c-type cytochrome, partial [Vulcanimicrobiaceae bacterium]